MFDSTRLRRFFGSLTLPVVSAALVAYFAYFAVQGDRGVVVLTALRSQAGEAESRLASLKAERERMENRVRLLRSDSLDPDMLDEQARVVLNRGDPDEVIIMTPRQAVYMAAKDEAIADRRP